MNATLIQSAAPVTVKTWELVVGGEPAAYRMSEKPELSKDPDATWTRQGSKSQALYCGRFCLPVDPAFAPFCDLELEDIFYFITDGSDLRFL